MNRLKQRLSALAVVGALLGGGLAAVAVPASAAEGVVVVQSKSDAPETTVWTDGVPDPATCTVTDTGVNTVPGQRHEAETELRTPYKQVIPGQTELSHQEYKYSRTVADYKTQYFFAKFTHTKTRTWIKEVPAQAAVYEKFTWKGPYAPTVAPPSEGWKSAGTTSDTKGSKPDVIQHQGNGNGSYFYFKTTKAAVPAVPGYWSAWSDYGPWTLWTPIQHTSWQDSNAPIGSPEFHGGGGNGDNFYREWQQRPTGETKQVQTGTHDETTDWLTAPPAGEGWTQVDVRTVKDREATADKTVYFLPGGEPTTTLTDANYTATNPGTPWIKAGDDKRFETKAAYSDPDVVTNYSHTYKSKECTIPPTPANPQASIEAICGAADITLTNPVTGEDGQITASFVVFVDGEFHKAYSVEGDKSENVRLTFDEDSGEHVVEVFQAGTSEWKSIAKASVPSDCIEPQPENKITETDWVTGEFECGDTTVQITRQVTSTEYVLVEGAWVPEGESVTVTQTDTRALTEEELASLECETEEPPVVTPPTATPTPSATPTPAPAPETGSLAATGIDGGVLWGAGIAVIILIAVGTYLLVGRRKKIEEAESVETE